MDELLDEEHIGTDPAADEIGATQLQGAPLVGTQATQEMPDLRVMMEDFDESTRLAGDALAAVASVEADAQASSG